jgi:peptide/nickel transport system substrate-binding protein
VRLERAIESAFASDFAKATPDRKATADKGERGTSEAKKEGEVTKSAEKYPGDEGDWLVWAFRVEPKTLNQINVDGDIYSRWITTPQIFEPLMVYDFDEAELRPLLAESYEISEDGLAITFRLRGDIYFSDGAAVTADDVIFTYETIVNPKVDAANISNLYVDVEKAIKIDERTVKFLIKRRYFKALEILSFWDVGIYPKHIYEFADAEEFNKRISRPVGSGPYVFEKWDVGQQIVLRRNERYWGRKPNIRKVVYKFIDNSVAAVQAFRSREVDILIPEPDQFAELAGDAEFAKEFVCLSYWNPGDPFYYIGWNQNTPWFGDRRVRLAMTYLIDRKEIVAKLLKGHGEVITGPYYIKGTQNDATIEPWPYDPKKAGKLLDDAGWIDSDGDGVRDKGGVPFRFRFIYSSGSVFYERLVKLLKDEMSKAGIELVAEPYEWSVLLPRLSDRQFEAMVMGWGGDIVEDNYQIFHSSQIGNRGSNYVGFNNAEADRLLEEIRRTLDVSERDKLCHRLHGILHEEQPYTFLCTRPTFRFVDQRFKNVKIHKLGLNYLEWYVPQTEQRYK